jgi:hypothetical protein
MRSSAPDAFAQQILRLRDVREHFGPQLQRCIENLGSEVLPMRLLPSSIAGTRYFVRGDTYVPSSV